MSGNFTEVWEKSCSYVSAFIRNVKLPKLTSVGTIKNAMSYPLRKAKLACFV